MNTRKHMIIVKGEIKTPEIKFCHYNAQTQKMDITYQSGKLFSYMYHNVEWLKEPKALMTLFGISVLAMVPNGITCRASYRLSNPASIRSKPKMSMPIFG